MSTMQLSSLPYSLSVIPGPISWIIQTTPIIETATWLHLGHYLFYICSLIFTGFMQSACAALASRTPNLVIAASPLLRQASAQRGEEAFFEKDLMHSYFQQCPLSKCYKMPCVIYVKVYRLLLLGLLILLPLTNRALQKSNSSCLCSQEHLSAVLLMETSIRKQTFPQNS